MPRTARCRSKVCVGRSMHNVAQQKTKLRSAAKTNTIRKIPHKFQKLLCGPLVRRWRARCQRSNHAILCGSSVRRWRARPGQPIIFGPRLRRCRPRRRRSSFIFWVTLRTRSPASDSMVVDDMVHTCYDVQLISSNRPHSQRRFQQSRRHRNRYRSDTVSHTDGGRARTRTGGGGRGFGLRASEMVSGVCDSECVRVRIPRRQTFSACSRRKQ